MGDLAPDTDVGERVRKVIDFYLGSGPEQPTGVSTYRTAAILGLHHRSLKRRHICTAEAMFAGSRALPASVLSKLRMFQVIQKELRIEAVITNLLYDETLLIVRHRDKDKRASDTSPVTSKLLCCELDVSIFVRHFISANLISR